MKKIIVPLLTLVYVFGLSAYILIVSDISYSSDINRSPNIEVADGGPVAIISTETEQH